VKVARRAEYEILGGIIAKAREDLGLTQRALARKVGRTETAIHKIEQGNQRADLIELMDIASALRLSLAALAESFEQAVKDASGP
jgi:transcriptional regulator with XRE-family HTH domain